VSGDRGESTREHTPRSGDCVPLLDPQLFREVEDEIAAPETRRTPACTRAPRRGPSKSANGSAARRLSNGFPSACHGEPSGSSMKSA